MIKATASAAFAGLSLMLCIAALAIAARGDVQHQSFKAFYCAGSAVREGRDPYRVEPSRSCERLLEARPMPAGYVEPAPLPGYALAPFAALSNLSPKRAAEIYALVLALASIFGALALAKTLPAPAVAVLLALMPLTLLNIAYGEVAPLAMFAIAGAGFWLARERWDAAGVAVTCAMLQPNIGLPAVIALALFAPRCRRAIGISAVTLAAISVASLGAARNVEYFRAVLPAMAHAEIVASDQYSLARLLYAAGIAERMALLAGQVWFALIGIAGIVLSARIAAMTQRRELLAFIPPAAVLFFGIYLHDVQLLVALPAALAIAAIAPRGVARALATAGLALLTAVWTQPARIGVLVIDAAGVAGAIFAIRREAPARRATIAAAVSCAAIALLAGVQHVVHPLTASALSTSAFGALPDELSPAAWARYLRATPALVHPSFAPQTAAWLGLTGMLIAAAARTAKPIRS